MLAALVAVFGLCIAVEMRIDRADVRRHDSLLLADELRHVDAEAELRRHSAGRDILVVDDEPIDREVALTQLAVTDLAGEKAEDGAEPAFLAGKNKYATILMDMQVLKLSVLRLRCR